MLQFFLLLFLLGLLSAHKLGLLWPDSINGMRSDLVETSQDQIVELTDALKELGESIEKFSAILKTVRAAGWKDSDIRDAILSQLPDEAKPAFMQQWPMMSMMFAAL